MPLRGLLSAGPTHHHSHLHFLLALSKKDLARPLSDIPARRASSHSFLAPHTKVFFRQTNLGHETLLQMHLFLCLEGDTKPRGMRTLPYPRCPVKDTQPLAAVQG